MTPSLTWLRRSDVSHDQEDWLAYTRVDWGYGRVTVHDGYSLTFEFVLSKVRYRVILGRWLTGICYSLTFEVVLSTLPSCVMLGQWITSIIAAICVSTKCRWKLAVCCSKAAPVFMVYCIVLRGLPSEPTQAGIRPEPSGRNLPNLMPLPACDTRRTGR